MSYPKKQKNWRKIEIEGKNLRWRLVTKEEDSLLKLQGGNSSSRQAIFILRGWRDIYLSWSDNVEPNEPRIITPKFVSQAAAFALNNGWNSNESGSPLYFEYRPEEFYSLSKSVL